MKTRDGFVSNSSSSSYLISYKSNKRVFGSGKERVFLGDLLGIVPDWYDKQGECTRMRVIEFIDNMVRASSEKEILDDLFCRFGLDDNEFNADRQEHATELRAKIMDEVTKGKKIAALEISYHDTGYNDLFNILKKKKLITVLEGTND